VVEALGAAGCSSFGHFDILSDAAVREGMRVYSNWPTYPQLYASGELLGGCDIVAELAASGELKAALDKATTQAAAAAAAEQQQPLTVTQRIQALLASAPVMLFMKGVFCFCAACALLRAAFAPSHEHLRCVARLLTPRLRRGCRLGGGAQVRVQPPRGGGAPHRRRTHASALHHTFFAHALLLRLLSSGAVLHV
jgi:glutaredoxin-related protein